MLYPHVLGDEVALSSVIEYIELFVFTLGDEVFFIYE